MRAADNGVRSTGMIIELVSFDLDLPWTPATGTFACCLFCARHAGVGGRYKKKSSRLALAIPSVDASKFPQ